MVETKKKTIVSINQEQITGADPGFGKGVHKGRQAGLSFT